MRTDDEKAAPNSSTAKKKTYRSPELIIYGTIRQMTQSVDITGMLDGVLTLKTA